MPFAHTRLLVVNFPACFRFYRDVLGLRPSWGDENDAYASFAQEGKLVLALFRRQEMAKVVGTSDLPLNPPAQDHTVLVFQVPDVDAAVLQLEQQGVEFVAEPADFADWGVRSAYLRDPDGNLVELYSDLAVERWTEGMRESAEKWHGSRRAFRGE